MLVIRRLPTASGSIEETTMQTTVIEDWGDAILAAVSTALTTLVNAIPAVLGALLILLVGWILSNVLAGLVERGLRAANVDGLLERHGGQVYGERATTMRASSLVAQLVKWVIRLIFIIAAANALNLPQVSEFLNAVLLWLPNLFVAIVILLVAPIIGRFLRGLIETGAGSMGFTNAGLLGRLAEYAVIAFAVLIAIDQVGIASDLLNTLLIGVVGALALAFGLAFGLGGRDVAAEITRSWYESTRSTAEKVKDRASAATATGEVQAGATRPVRRTSPSSLGQQEAG
jgi:hypothetical protein